MAHLGLITGTRVMTIEGEVAVEKLRSGAQALTLASTERPIQPLTSVAIGPVPEGAWPILVRAGAVAEGMPIRDLLLAPDQALVMREDADDAIKLDFSKRRLIPARVLANAATVTRVRPPGGSRYYRPIVASPDLLMANGICVGVAGPGASPALPLMEGEAAQPYHARLLVRARDAGWADTEEPRLAVEFEGEPIPPRHHAGPALSVDLPEAVQAVVLASRATVPDELDRSATDTRRLGVAVAELRLDGTPIPLDSPLLGAGWYPPERDGSGVWRWTDGTAALALPPRTGTARLDIRIHWGWGRYRVSPEASPPP